MTIINYQWPTVTYNKSDILFHDIHTNDTMFAASVQTGLELWPWGGLWLPQFNRFVLFWSSSRQNSLPFQGKHLSVFVRFIIWGLSLVREYSKTSKQQPVFFLSLLLFVFFLFLFLFFCFVFFTFVALLKYYRKGHFIPFSLAVVESLVVFRSPLLDSIQSALGELILSSQTPLWQSVEVKKTHH